MQRVGYLSQLTILESLRSYLCHRPPPHLPGDLAGVCISRWAITPRRSLLRHGPTEEEKRHALKNARPALPNRGFCLAPIMAPTIFRGVILLFLCVIWFERCRPKIYPTVKRYAQSVSTELCPERKVKSSRLSLPTGVWKTCLRMEIGRAHV